MSQSHGATTSPDRSASVAPVGPRPTRRHLRALALLTFLAVPGTAAAQDFLFRGPVANLTFRGGFNFARAGSELFEFTMEQLTLDKSDFGAASFGVDLGVQLSDRLDVFAGFTHMAAARNSEFREFEEEISDDVFVPITQRTRFSQTPITGGLRYFLAPRGRQVGRFVWIPNRVVPYVGAAGGVLSWQFNQEGDWVDYQDLGIFTDRFEADGLAAVAQALAGLDFSVGNRAILNTEARYTIGSGELVGDYIGFDRLDLSGLQITLGLKFRF